jgi:hypothetical protein
MNMTPDETTWNDHDEHPGPGRDAWRFTRTEQAALATLVKAAGPVTVMDVTTADEIRAACLRESAARRLDESAARLARYARRDVGYRLLG